MRDFTKVLRTETNSTTSRRADRHSHHEFTANRTTRRPSGSRSRSSVNGRLESDTLSRARFAIDRRVGRLPDIAGGRWCAPAGAGTRRSRGAAPRANALSCRCEDARTSGRASSCARLQHTTSACTSRSRRTHTPAPRLCGDRHDGPIDTVPWAISCALGRARPASGPGYTYVWWSAPLDGLRSEAVSYHVTVLRGPGRHSAPCVADRYFEALFACEGNGGSHLRRRWTSIRFGSGQSCICPALFIRSAARTARHNRTGALQRARCGDRP